MRKPPLTTNYRIGVIIYLYSSSEPSRGLEVAALAVDESSPSVSTAPAVAATTKEFRIPVVNGFAAHSSDGSSSSSQHSSDSHHGSSDQDEEASGGADKKSCSSLVPKRQKPKPNLRLPCAANSALKRESNGHITMATEDLLQPGHVVKERWKVVRMPHTLVPFP